jgi:hypothetical protein
VRNSWNETGNFYVRVAGRGDAFSTSGQFTLNVVKGRDDLHGRDAHVAALDPGRRRWRT